MVARGPPPFLAPSGCPRSRADVSPDLNRPAGLRLWPSSRGPAAAARIPSLPRGSGRPARRRERGCVSVGLGEEAVSFMRTNDPYMLAAGVFVALAVIGLSGFLVVQLSSAAPALSGSEINSGR